MALFILYMLYNCLVLHFFYRNRNELYTFVRVCACVCLCFSSGFSFLRVRNESARRDTSCMKNYVVLLVVVIGRSVSLFLFFSLITTSVCVWTKSIVFVCFCNNQISIRKIIRKLRWDAQWRKSNYIFSFKRKMYIIPGTPGDPF